MHDPMPWLARADSSSTTAKWTTLVRSGKSLRAPHLSPLHIYHDRVVSYLRNANYHSARGGYWRSWTAEDKTFVKAFLARVIASGYTILSLLSGGKNRQNPPRQVVANIYLADKPKGKQNHENSTMAAYSCWKPFRSANRHRGCADGSRRSTGSGSSGSCCGMCGDSVLSRTS